MSTVTVNPQGVKKEVTKGTITLDKLSAGQFQKPGTITAQLRQIITTVSTYPAKKTTSNLQENIFEMDDFGFKGQVFTSTENRMAFILVPENTTEEIVKSKIEASVKTGACIYRVLSSVPILDDNQKYAITAGLKTLDDFADTQVVRYPNTEDNAAKGFIRPDGTGKIWLDTSGKVQYRRTFLWKSPMEDRDIRGNEVGYMSPNIKSELEGAAVLAGQTL